MKIIAVSNQKGGVAKTTTACCLSSGLVQKGFRVLAVDMDPQTNLTMACGIQVSATDPTIYNLLTPEDRTNEHRSFDEVLKTTAYGLDVLPGSDEMAAIDAVIKNPMMKYWALQKALQPIRAQYDYIIIDTPPELGTLTLMAHMAATDVIIPVTASLFDLDGVMKLSKTIESVREVGNHDLKIMGVLLTRHNPRTLLSKKMATYLEETICPMIGTKPFDTYIRSTSLLMEAQMAREDLFAYAPDSTAAKDYMSLVNEVIERS